MLKSTKPYNLDEYRSLPFWSWNDKLEEKELVEQIKWMKEQGFGGYFMHARGGLITEYLSKEWFDCIKACCDKGEEFSMQSWVYDENGWPSGFVGGKLLDDEYNKDRYLTYKIGEFDSNSLVSYLIEEERLIRTAENGKGEYLNIYEHVSTSTADILNEKVVDKFIKETHEKYKGELGKEVNKKLSGFFTDEPQYYRWSHPYTQVLSDYFKKVYNQDVLDGLGLLFVEKEGYRDFRYKYWLAMQTLLVNSFAKKVYNWCDSNALKLTGHYIEETSLAYQMLCCGGIMPLYEYMHIPGIDKLGRDIGGSVSAKQVSSVARQLGKKKVLTETFACAGWDVTPSELKSIAEIQYVNGINLMCQHLVPYSEHGQRKRDYPAHFSYSNPWVKDDFKPFNDYFAKLGCLLGESKELVKVGLFCPIRSMYFDYKREDFEKVTYPVDVEYLKTCDFLSKSNIPYHIIDETIMEKHCSIKDGKLIVGECEYDYIIFPKVYTMGKVAYGLFKQFYNQNGKILFNDNIPEYLEGQEFEYEISSNCTMQDIFDAQEYSIGDKNTAVMSTYREIGGKKFIYAVNTSRDIEYDVEFFGKFKGFISYDLESEKTQGISKKIHFNKGQSYILFLDNKAYKENKKQKAFKLDDPFEVVSCTDNYYTLDKVRFSIDGINYSDKLSCMGVFNEMLERRYKGELYLKYEFETNFIPEKIDLLAEDLNNISTTVNGIEIEFDGVSDFEKQIYRANIAHCVKKGVNEIITKINFYEDDNVYYALFGENVTESLKNCLVYNTTIEACYLQGDFGVYAKNGFKNGKENNVLIAENFYIDKRKTVINGDIVREGYPFFAGKMTLRTQFDKNTATKLELQGRHHLCEIKINGINVKKSYFESEADLSQSLSEGKNQAEVTLYFSNRNLLGPHHYKHMEEPFGVGPYTFELTNTWEKGKSPLERDDYSFVRLGLF